MNTFDKMDAAKANVSTTLSSAAVEAREKLAVAILQYGFLRANWGKVSTIVVLGVGVGFVLGAVIF